MLVLKYFIVSIFIYLSFLSATVYFYFNNISNTIIKNEISIRNLEFINFKEKIKNSILDNQYRNTSEYLDQLTKSNKYEYIKLKYTNHFLTSKSIIIHANKSIDMSWQLNDVTVDAKYGSIKVYSPTLYIIKEAPMYDFEDGLIFIKSQAENQTTIMNIISGINYSLPQYKNELLDNNSLSDKLKYFISINNNEERIELYINNSVYAEIIYKYNNNYIYENIFNILVSFFIYFNILFISLVIIYIILNYIIMQYTTNKYLSLLKIYTSDILKNNFYKFDSDKLVYKNIKDIANDISLISKKMATIINELNVNKNVLDLKVSTDNLTNLPNNKMFELEMKNLFLNKVPSYIVKIKLVCLSSYSNNHSTSDIDTLILSFVDKINKTMLKKDTMSLYRLYGSDFFLIVRDTTFNDMNDFLNELSNNIVEIRNKFEIKTKIAHMISIPFNHYSNTKDLLNKINNIYQKTINIPKQISFYNEDNSKQDEDNTKLIKIVESIIKNSAFTLSYKFDTYRFKDNKLIMQEVSPNLINYDGSTIAIGTFISVATELKLAVEFDKDVIEKSFSFVEKNDIDYILAINISIDSILNENFITWLESKLLYDYDKIKHKVVFSVTSFAAKNNFDEFKNFTNNIKRFNGQVILKRFNYNDLTLDQLEKINLNYIRVHSEYTDNIDKQKESILRNISDFCIANDIILLADMVPSELDYSLLESINLYGTSK
jgi:EAL domain-containing protein (putative c-di-GMP-specific phosphodiesterase class I)